MRFIQLLAILWVVVLSGKLLAQPNTDSLVYTTALDNALNKSLRIQRAINVGSEYKELPRAGSAVHPFYFTSDTFEGDVYYNGIQYKNIDLQYDILLDEVVTEHFSGKKIILFKQKVTEFTLDGQVFRKLLNPIVSGTKPAYYHILVDGPTIKLLAKHEKKVRRNYYIKETSFIEESTRYYVVKDSNFYRVSSYKEIIKLLDKGKKSTIKLNVKSKEARMIETVKQISRFNYDL